MPRADKKQRNKLKRTAKKLQLRRRNSISPIKRLGDAKGELETWMSADFEVLGQMQIFVYKRAAGLSGVACFLIDRGVVGLKDAWTRMPMQRDELNRMIESSGNRGITMYRSNIENARAYIAGAARWAHDNGMRLPRDLAKAASFIDGMGDWQAADLSKFTREFFGHPDDLRQRLIGESFDSYIQRSDIAFTFFNDAPYLHQESGDYRSPGGFIDELDDDEIESIANHIPVEEIEELAANFTPAAIGLAGDTTTWLDARNQTPSTELVHAWQSLMLALMLSKSAMPDAPETEVADFGSELLQDISKRIEEPCREEYHRAVGQALQYLQTDSMMMQKATLKYGLANEAPHDSE